MKINDNKLYENRVSSYLNMSPQILISSLNYHYDNEDKTDDLQKFDLNCLIEAIKRSPIDNSQLLIKGENKFKLNGPFRLDNHPDHELAKKILPKGCGAVFTFEIKGGFESGKKFIESLNIFSHLANVGDAKSLVIHPASTTHFRMDKPSLKKAGITEDTVRLSIGIEDINDLKEDLDEALKKASR